MTRHASELLIADGIIVAVSGRLGKRVLQGWQQVLEVFVPRGISPDPPVGWLVLSGR